ncbi:KGGVGR-motif variant AAA ATPase [Geochorda subterranea]|uniref:P-loop NTPase n=1 Tax=Geochorda subterranea TaxID=3109564 RepID=A0ABZ1BPS5_9FIRM|nr:P-loop NTPase [Limnochorda sp. LNt]WRP14719.1 P-loop NTPase [Limnochorda sp. LNt]
MTTQMGSLSVYLVDRLLTGMGWGKVPEGLSARTRRYTLFSLKGGVGRSTTAAVLATHLAGRGLRVLVVDLDLESPGLSSMLLAPGEHPDYGVVDWFVEDLVGQSDPVLAHMVGRPRWCQDLQGDILVAPAYGSDPGEYISKLGRVYLDLPADGPDAVVEPWSARLVRMLVELENRHKPDVVLLDSRSGLHDLAAATVTDLQAQVFLFAVDSEATWAGYRLLFDYWRAHGAATVIRQRLSLVASLVPQERASVLLKRMRERAWDLFREYLYDTVPADPEEEARTEPFSFDLMDDEAPHSPWPIYWNTGLSWVPSIRGLEEPAVFAAYQGFLERFDELSMAAQEGQP